MKKYTFLFAISFCFIGVKAIAQSPAVATTQQSVVVKDTVTTGTSDSPASISPANRNQQSIIVPASSGNTLNNSNTGSQGSAPQATPARGQSSAIDPKKSN